MKLNKKGLMRLLDVAFDGDEFYQSNALEVEFEPDDFVGGCCQNGKDHLVCLTVDEIFTLKQMVKWVLKSSSLGRTNTVFLEETYKILNKHFKQAEGK